MQTQTYTQDEKEKTREIIWEHSINSLTINRGQKTIFTPEIASEFTMHSANKAKELFAPDFIMNQIRINQIWLDYHQSVYKNKTSKDLKVAYFSGPEPINDLQHLLARGIQPENIWAFELGRDNYNEAKKQILEFGVFINLFQGKLEDFVNTYPDKFDIVYLDFTKHLISRSPSPALLINTIIQESFLSDLSVVIVNTCYPEKEEDNIKFLSDYHQNQ